MSGLTAHVQFCGAGGETLGAFAAGIEPVLAMNHWARAIESHSANFPDTEHLYADVVCLDPRAYPGADLLLTSPECRARSYARGRPKNDPSLFGPHEDAERSRATMWDVPRFAEVHRYLAIVVENVVQTVDWCEARVNRHGWNPKLREWRCNCGHDFRRWLAAMTELGYEHELVSFNSMFAPPTPQSRDRIYMVFWRKGLRRPNLDFRVPSWCPACERLVDAYQAWKRPPAAGRFQVGRYGQQYVYRCPGCEEVAHPAVTPAATAIDWTLPAQPIGEREKPLAPATLARIRRGLIRLGERPLVVAVGGNLYERPGYSRTWPIEQPMPTVTTTLERALVLSNMAGNVPRRAADEPAGTVTTGSKLYLVEPPPALVVGKNEGGVPRPVSEPAPTVTTIPQLYLLQLPGGLVVPLRNGSEPQSVRARDVGEPLPTQTTRQELGVAVVDLRGDPDRPGGPNRPRTVDEPISTVCASGNHHWLVVSNYGPGGGRRSSDRRPGGWARTTDEPVGTITARDGHAIVVPYRQGSGKPAVGPLPTATTVDPYALVEASLSIDECGFRMFEPHEIQRAMVMHRHVDGSPYVLYGSKRDRVKLAGNAVTPPVAYLIGERLVEAIT